MSVMKQLQSEAMVTGGFAAAVLLSIALVSGFKETSLVDNDTADTFITGIKTFAVFAGLVILAIVALTVMGLFKGKKAK